MPSEPHPLEHIVIADFHERRILTLDEISDLLRCSAVTSRRRLKQWRALTSYNQNNRYYTLPSIPTFDAHGLWHYRGVSFSKYGTCKQTVIHFVRRSEQGLSNTELAAMLGENPNSLMAHFKEIAGITRERHGRDVVYFCSDEPVYRRQHRNRFPPASSSTGLSPDARAIAILVERIHHPRMRIDELAAELRRKGHEVQAADIEALFQRYRIDKKKRNMKS
jgi:AraC-like DNA-binding protein